MFNLIVYSRFYPVCIGVHGKNATSSQTGITILSESCMNAFSWHGGINQAAENWTKPENHWIIRIVIHQLSWVLTILLLKKLVLCIV